jgi:UDP-N-acetylmuramoyl-L-alanyl-D-glutamate--2,6-diaminopimelate ligase
LPLPGRFNIENALAAVVAAVQLGLPFEVAVARLATAPQVPGRMEVLRREPFTVIIDFAHTPAALESLLTVVRPLTSGQLRVLFGAGGDRDRSKRRPMAEAVARHADRIWATSDNPRTEDPEAILDDLEPGLAGADHIREADRVRAIHGIISEAAPGDVVVLAGKGHETYQVVGSERRPLDERLVVAEALAGRGVT